MLTPAAPCPPTSTNNENANGLLRFLRFLVPLPLFSHRLPKTCKWWQSHEFSIIQNPTAPLPLFQNQETDEGPVHLSVIPKPAAPFPAHCQNHANDDRPCLSYDYEASCPPSRPILKTWKWWLFLMILKTHARQPTFTEMKMMPANAFLMILKPHPPKLGNFLVFLESES